MTGDEIDNVGATIVALGNNFATTERDIVSFSERIVGAGAIAGLTAPQVLALSTAFSSVGIEAEAGGTAVQKALIEINNAVASGGVKLNQFALASGMSAKQFQDAWRKDAGATFIDFVEGLSKSGDQASQVLDTLIGTDVRLQRAFLSLANATGEARRAMLLANAAFEEGTALNEEAARRFETTSSQLQLLKNRFFAVGDSIGSSFLPAIKWALKAVGDLVVGIGGLMLVFKIFSQLVSAYMGQFVNITVSAFSTI